MRFRKPVVALNQLSGDPQPSDWARADALAQELYEACDDNRRLEKRLEELSAGFIAQEKADRLRIERLVNENADLRALCRGIRILADSGGVEVAS